MNQKAVYFCISLLVVVGLIGCGAKDNSPIKVISQEMNPLPDQGIIIVKGVVQNVSDAPKLVYVHAGIYGDFGMVKDNKKKLLNGGEAMKPGDKLDFSFEFKFDPEVKSAKARAEGVDPSRSNK